MAKIYNMKTLSVASVKQTWTGTSLAYPKEGTVRAEIANKLKALPGVWVYLERTSTIFSALRALRDEYGFDIEKNPKAKHEYRIVGEWFGKEYVSYIDKNKNEQ